jgi:hypothetical protein
LLVECKIIGVEGEVVKSEERSRKRAERDIVQNPGEYYTLIVSIAVLGLCVFISTAVFRAPVSQFVLTIEKTIASVGGVDTRR